MDGISIGESITTIIDSRNIKAYSNEVGLTLKGGMGSELEIISSRADQLEHEGLLREKHSLVGAYMSQIPEEKIDTTFRDGLRIFLKQQYRTYKKQLTKI
jgi:hypothetical protein